MTAGIYIHIPFCRSKCSYCSFYSIPLTDSSLLDRYIDRLCNEIISRMPEIKNLKADTIYFGGGTPSLLDPEHVYNIIRTVRENVNLDRMAEITLEMNPEDAIEEKISGFTTAGVNRLVLGVQTSEPEFHEAIGRSTRLCSRDVIEEYFKQRGFVKGIDVITGLPGQELYNISEEFDMLLSYRPDHISSYILSIEKNTPLYSAIDAGPEFEERQRMLFASVISLLKNSGYRHYEISNFCIPGFESRHNMKYWKLDPYIGFGPSSHSFYGGERYFNSMSMADYVQADKAVVTRDIRSENSLLVELILTGLRLLDGISLGEAEYKTGKPVPELVYYRIHSLEKKGMLVLDNRNSDMMIKLSSEGFFFADSVIYDIVQDII